jgi:Domain of unknown function (DUF4932)/Bacterial Ig-like domain
MLVVLLLAALPFGSPFDRAEITVRCDARVELFSIVFRLAGNSEFHSEKAESPYARDVDQWFAKFRDHQAVLLARSLHAQYGIAYNAVPELAVHVNDAEHLEARLPLDPRPEKLDSRWTAAIAAPFLAALRQFVRDSNFVKFFAKHASLYDEAAERLKAEVAEADLEAWVRTFFGREARSVSLSLIPGLLCGPNNYGCSVRFPDGRHELAPVMGIWSWDVGGLPVFGSTHIPTVAHEFAHGFVNPLIDRYAVDLEEAGTVLFRTVEMQMRKQAYTTWRIMLYESLVRACVVRYVTMTQGATQAREQVRAEEARGFRWTAGLADLLAEYEQNRKTFPDLDAFAPKLVAFFAAEAVRHEAIEENSPEVVSIEPGNGATDVDPTANVIKITFDRPMKEASWSLTGEGPQFPTTNGEPSFDRARKVFSLPVKLEPGKTYHFGLNGPSNYGFQSEDGVPLPPIVVSFTTRS